MDDSLILWHVSFLHRGSGQSSANDSARTFVTTTIQQIEGDGGSPGLA
jgi:hypothetical protein